KDAGIFRRADPARTWISALVVTTWFAIAAPAGLPRWHRRAHEPGDRDGAPPMSPPELTAFVQAEPAKWGLVAKKLAPDAAR
ncbi:MAG: hypothetical protein ACJ8ES_10660, partial [Xanthobacteraceae bacterium]